MDCYQALANAIIIQAAKDYKTALKHNAHNPMEIEHNVSIKDLERFFCSEWFSVLSAVDGKILMNRIKSEALKEVVAA